MINIFDLMVAAGLPDPRVNKKFKEYLITNLNNIDDKNSGNMQQETTFKKNKYLDFESLSIYDKVEFIKKAKKLANTGQDKLLGNLYSNILLDCHLNGIDIEKTITIKDEDLLNIKELPKIEENKAIE